METHSDRIPTLDSSGFTLQGIHHTLCYMCYVEILRVGGHSKKLGSCSRSLGSSSIKRGGNSNNLYVQLGTESLTIGSSLCQNNRAATCAI